MERNDSIHQEYLFDGAVFEKTNPLLERIISFLFRKVDFDDTSLKILQEYSEKKVIYASFHTSNLSLLIFNSLLKRHGYKTPAAALDYNPFMLQPVKYLLRRSIRKVMGLFSGAGEDENINTELIEELLRQNNNVLLSLLSRKSFLKRYMEARYDALMHIVNIQKNTEDPLFLVPQIIFWNMNPEKASSTVSTGAAGYRGILSGWFTILKSTTPSFVRLCAPINIREEMDNSPADESRHIAAGLRNKLLEIYHNEKRIVLGPVIKSRQMMAERVLNHRNILDEIKRLAGENSSSEKRLKKRAYRYYGEISANFSITMIRFFEIVLDIIFRKIFDGISYDPADLEMIREASLKGPLVITPCHKSHMDYLIVSYIFFKNKLMPPHIAAGVNLSFFPMGFIFRHAGAFFMRRSFRGLTLYPEVFKQYIKTMINEGYPIEFFIEGGRTRTGKLAYPRYGFLNYLIEAIDEGYNRDLVFVPISINYERILEETSYVKEMKGRKKEAESAMVMLESTRLLRRKYGKVYVSFNKPFTLKEIEAGGAPKEDLPGLISENIIKKINEITIVTPFSIASTTILLHVAKGFSRKSLLEMISMLYGYLAYINTMMSDTLQRKVNLEGVIDMVFSAFLDDRIIEPLKDESGKEMDDFYILNEDQRPRIVFYKNSIIHYLIPIAFYSSALLYLHSKNELSHASLDIEYDQIKKMFSSDFIYVSNKESDESGRDIGMLEYLRTESIVEIEGEIIRVSDESLNTLRFFSRIILDYFESYLIVIQALVEYRKQKAGKREFVQEIRKNGIKLFHTGKVKLMESLSLPNYTNALKMLSNEGIVREISAGKKDLYIEILDRNRAKTMLDKINSYLYLLG